MVFFVLTIFCRLYLVDMGVVGVVPGRAETKDMMVTSLCARFGSLLGRLVLGSSRVCRFQSGRFITFMRYF